MKFFLFLFGTMVYCCLFFQSSFSEEDSKKFISTFFEGFHSGDSLKMKLVMAEKIAIPAAFTDKSSAEKVNTGNIYDFILAIAQCPENEK